MKASDVSRATSLRKDGAGFGRQDYVLGLASSVVLGGLGGKPNKAEAAEINLLQRIESPELKSPGLAGFGSPTVVFLPR